MLIKQEVVPHLSDNSFSTDVYQLVKNHKITKQHITQQTHVRLFFLSQVISFCFYLSSTKCLFLLLHPSPSPPLVISVSGSVWTFCYHYCRPLWPNPHIYKASQKTRMIIVIGHPQNTVQLHVLVAMCHLALYFSSLLC